MYVDVQYSIWGRYSVPSKVEEDVLKRLEEGEDIESIAESLSLPFEYIPGTEEELSPEDTGDYTVVAIDENDNEVFSNYSE